MSDQKGEISLNLWFLIDEAVGFVYALMGRAYMLGGSDSEKLRILHSLAPTDYLLAKKHRVPENFTVVDPAGNRRGRLVDPRMAMDFEQVPFIFESVIQELEKDLPPEIVWVDGEMVTKPQEISPSPLMVCTGLLEHHDGRITPLTKQFEI
jgi:hypothetical protein